jgi:dephospho-CoA kinase
VRGVPSPFIPIHVLGLAQRVDVGPAIGKLTRMCYNTPVMKYVIGLTGNIGSGKSTVLRMLEQLGAKAIDADALVHEVMGQGTLVWQAIVDTFGQEILTDQGEIDRKKLGALVFDDHEALKRLENIVHPAVDQRFREIVQDSEERVIAVEAIKITESEVYAQLDTLWLVTCPAEERLQRLVETRHVNEEDVERRLRSQMPPERQAELADVVIDNGGTLQQTWEQVRREWGKIW